MDIIDIQISMASEQDLKSAFKFAKLEALSKTCDITIIDKILDQEGDINFAIPLDSSCKISRSDIIGNTVLHFAYAANKIEFFKSLLLRGADFTRRNQNGHTVLHMVFAKHNIHALMQDPFVNAILSEHINSNNFSNPYNNVGISHFHIACMTNNVEAVQFFLENGVSVDESVDINSKLSPGYTALHFAAKSTNTKIAEILVAYGANIHIANAKHMTPLHILVERRIGMYNSINKSECKNEDFIKTVQEKIDQNEKIINMLLENMSIDNDCLENLGLSNYHVACTLQDMKTVENLTDQAIDLDHCVNMDSPLWPGYTALHFAAYTNILETGTFRRMTISPNGSILKQMTVI